MKENIRMMNISDELNKEECKKNNKKTGLEVEIMKMHWIKKRYFYHIWKWVSLTTLHGKKSNIEAINGIDVNSEYSWLN